MDQLCIFTEEYVKWMFPAGHQPNMFFYPEVYSEPYEKSKMKLFAKIGNDFESLFILGKRSIIDVWQVSEYAT